jgi:hypothetical protein
MANDSLNGRFPLLAHADYNATRCSLTSAN